MKSNIKKNDHFAVVERKIIRFRADGDPGGPGVTDIAELIAFPNDSLCMLGYIQMDYGIAAEPSSDIVFEWYIVPMTAGETLTIEEIEERHLWAALQVWFVAGTVGNLVESGKHEESFLNEQFIVPRGSNERYGLHLVTNNVSIAHVFICRIEVEFHIQQRYFSDSYTRKHWDGQTHRFTNGWEGYTWEEVETLLGLEA